MPLTETISYLCSFIETNSIPIPVSTTTIKELLLRCTFNVQFQFNNTYYRQTDGVAMGSPLGPLLADIFMSKLENGPLKRLIENMPFYKRYVGDVFAILNDKNDLNRILNQFNMAHPSIHFTHEEEMDGSFHFLDVQLDKRADGSLKRSIYRKPTWSGQYTNFNSFVPLKQKRNLIYCLTSRAKKICSEDALDQELLTIANILRLNGFPDRFITKHINQNRSPVEAVTVQKKPVYLSLPFKGDLLADRLNRRIYTSLNRTYPAAKLCSWFTTKRMISFNLKDRVPVHAQNMVVYSFSCCCAAEYIGRTTRTLSQRIREHIPRWLSTDSKKTITSSIVQHLADTEHRVDKNQAFKILYKAPVNQPRSIQIRSISIAEAIAIRLRKPILCRQKRLVRALELPWPDLPTRTNTLTTTDTQTTTHPLSPSPLILSSHPTVDLN